MDGGETGLRRRANVRPSVRLLAGIALVGLLAMNGGPVSAQAKPQKETGKDKDISVTVHGKDTDAGLIVSARATAKEVGLPLYPGAVPYEEKENDSSAAKLGLWGKTFGFKLVVLQMRSADTPKKIAEYYQKALAKYGTVLDCTNAPRTPG